MKARGVDGGVDRSSKQRLLTRGVDEGCWPEELLAGDNYMICKRAKITELTASVEQ